MQIKKPVKHMHLAIQIIPPRSELTDPTLLETAMQSLLLDKQSPIALEVAGTGTSKRFIIRATRQASLIHAASQIRIRYPQAQIRPLSAKDDPFFCRPHETVSVIELKAGAATYLPLKSWEDKEMMQGADPILGLLAALSVPEDMRAIAQATIVPSSQSWSKPSLRKSVEHPLDKEKGRGGSTSTVAISSTTALLAGPVLALVAVIVFASFPHIVPPLLLSIGLTILHGQSPRLSNQDIVTLGQWGGECVVVLLVVGTILDQIRRRLTSPIYDQELVAQRTMRMAYRIRLRLYVIGPGPSISIKSMLFAFFKGEEWYSLSSIWHEMRRRRDQYRRRQDMLSSLVSAYKQYHLASAGFFVPHRLSTRSAQRLLQEPYGLFPWRCGWYRGIHRSKHLITVDSLAALWHMPQSTALQDLPMLEHRRSRTLLIPPTLVMPGGDSVGVSEHGGHEIQFSFPDYFLQRHTLIGGKSGEGKSTCMQHIAKKAMESGGGLFAVDPHGDLADAILQLVPPERVKDVVLIDLADPDAAVGLNPLDVTLGRDRDKAIADMLSTFSHIWDTSWGPRMESAFEAALKTIFEANRFIVSQDPEFGPNKQYTILDVMRLLNDEDFCHKLLENIEDKFVQRWWTHYYEPLSEQLRREVTSPVLTKVAKFEMKAARCIVGQPRSTVNFSQFIKEKKIILVRLAKGVVGADAAPLLGATLLGLLSVALEEQAVLQEKDRVRMPIIIDEFQALVGVDYQTMLAELRKYGATFFLATQSLDYLKEVDPMLLPTVMANVRQMIVYRMSGVDATLISPELGVTEEDIINLDPHQCYVKMSDRERQISTFSLKMHLPPTGNMNLLSTIRRQSREFYTRPVESVERQLQANLRLDKAPAPYVDTKGRGQNGRNQNSGRGQDGRNQNSGRTAKSGQPKNDETQQHLPEPQEVAHGASTKAQKLPSKAPSTPAQKPLVDDSSPQKGMQLKKETVQPLSQEQKPEPEKNTHIVSTPMAGTHKQEEMLKPLGNDAQRLEQVEILPIIPSAEVYVRPYYTSEQYVTRTQQEENTFVVSQEVVQEKPTVLSYPYAEAVSLEGPNEPVEHRVWSSYQRISGDLPTYEEEPRPEETYDDLVGDGDVEEDDVPVQGGLVPIQKKQRKYRSRKSKHSSSTSTNPNAYASPFFRP